MGIRLQGLPADTLMPNELRQIKDALRYLTRGLSATRDLAGAQYLDDPRLLGAYLLYFWPISYMQARYALSALELTPQELKSYSFLDLGSGPGPVALAMAHSGAPLVTAADRSHPALRIITELSHAAKLPVATKQWNGETDKLPAGNFTVITMSHLINELFIKHPQKNIRRAQLIESFFAKLPDNGHIIIIEPALKSTSRDLMQIRDYLVEKGFFIKAPCTMCGPCPALKDDAATCHATYQWHIPNIISQIVKEAGMDREELKLAYMIISKKKIEPNPDIYRIVSDPMLNKAGRTRMLVCGEKGRISFSCKRGEGFTAERDFFMLKRGDAVEIVNSQERGEGISLNNHTMVRKIWSP
jgi:predicted nicotinamide N-methyase